MSKPSQDDMKRQLLREIADMKAAAAVADWGRTDFANLKPSDIGVRLGPMLTEEQFREYRKQAGGAVRVVKAPTPKNS